MQKLLSAICLLLASIAALVSNFAPAERGNLLLWAIFMLLLSSALEERWKA